MIFYIKSPVVLIEIPFLEKKKVDWKYFIKKFNKFPNESKKNKSISRLKNKNKHKVCKTCKGVRSCGEKHTNNTTLPNIYKVI